MKSVSVIATVFGMVGAVNAQTNCCAQKYIIEAAVDGTQPMRRLATTAGLACVERGTQIENVLFDAAPASGTVEWMVKGSETVIEPYFTRLAIDLMDDTYWDQTDPAAPNTPLKAPAAERVIVIRVPGNSNLAGDWTTGTGPTCSTCTGLCFDPTPGPNKWNHMDLATAYDVAGSPPLIVIKEQGATGWDADIALVVSKCTANNPSNCKMTVVEETGNGLFEDVKAGLVALNELTGTCDICPNTSTSTAATSAPTNAPTTAAATTTTADSAARTLAGIIPVAAASLLAFLI